MTRARDVSQVLEETFAGERQLTLALTTSTWESQDSLPIFDYSVSRWKRLPLFFIKDHLLPYTTFDYIVTTTVTDAQTAQRLTNRGATTAIEFDLPAATVGLRYSFSRIANYAVRLDPNLSEIISDGGAGKYLEITGRGQVDIECLAAGVWEVTGGSAVYTFEV